MSERLKALKTVWAEFENQAVITIKDMRKLSETFMKAQLEIERLEDSRNSWRKRCELAESKLKNQRIK